MDILSRMISTAEAQAPRSYYSKSFGYRSGNLSLADELVNAGFEVVMPHLFDLWVRHQSVGTLLESCLRKEFRLMTSDRSSPIADWVRLLCREVRDQRGVKGVVIGMCLTGNFAIQLIGDDMSCSRSITTGNAFFKQGELHMSPDDIEQSHALDVKGPMRVLRFEDDPLCTQEKSKCVHRAFNDDGNIRVQEITLLGRGHSVLTLDFVDKSGHPTREP